MKLCNSRYLPVSPVTLYSTVQHCTGVGLFADDHLPSNQPALWQYLPANPQPMTTVYTGGFCTNNGKLNAKSRAGIWYEDDHPLNKAIRIPGPDQSNQTGELAGILVALQSSLIATELTIVTNLQYAIKTLTHSLPNFKDAGWANVPNT